VALGVGGYPRGRIIEIYGPESSGKTTLAIHAIAEAQKAGGIAAFIDAEQAFSFSLDAILLSVSKLSSSFFAIPYSTINRFIDLKSVRRVLWSSPRKTIHRGVPRKRVICATTTPNYAKSAMK